MRVTGSDGKVRVIDANLLVSIDTPSEPEEAPAFAPESPPLTTSEVSTITGKPPYFPLKYGDGNDPMVGQKVKAGKGAKEIEGVVVWITPPGGKQASIKPYADVMTSDGKKTKKSLSMITVIEGAPSTPKAGLPDDTKAAAEIVADFTPHQISDMALKYVMPDGHTLSQPQYEKDQWLAGSPKRKLTKDGYAPRVGMRMRTNQDEPVVVVSLGDPFKAPNYVRVVHLSGEQKEESRAVSALWVDHPAEVGTPDGTSLDYIRGITVTNPDSAVPPVEKLPNGTIIYKAVADSQVYIGGQYRSIDNYFFITASGQLQSLGGGPAAHPTNSKNQLAKLAATGKLEKVAIVDEAAPDYGAYTAYAEFQGSGTNPTAFVLYNPGEFSHEEALSGHFLELTATPVKGAEIAPTIPKENLSVNLPKPAEAIDVTGEDMLPDPPAVTGVVGEIDEVPKSIPVRSVTEAGLEIFAQKDETGPGTGTEYAFGDAEFIEDMSVRSQMVKDLATSESFVEFHFRMQEDKAEATADKLLIAGKDTKYGKWEARPEPVRASELEVGNAISVRTSSMSDMMKPSNGETPNVRVVAAPVLLGADSKGTPIYRVAVASADGTTGAIDIQERALPSMKVYDWNPAAIASVSTSTQVSLSAKAIAAGWIEIDHMGYDHNPTAGSISMDETGAKLFSGSSINNGGNAGTLGKRLQRKFSDGTYIRMNAVPSSVSGTEMGGGQIRRANEAGMVTIRVPVALAENPDEFQAAVSKAMEAVGIPPHKQGPASDEQIAVFALNKVYKTHAATFNHRAAPVQQASMDDPAVSQMLKRMNSQLSQYLGREITLDDIELKVFDDGRLQVLMSKDVARAITKNQGNVYYRHSGHFDDIKVAEILAGPNRGLMGGSERFSLGIFTTGLSVYTDMGKGSGNRVYMTGKTQAYTNDSGAFVFSADAINRSTEVYVNGSDTFGARSTSNTFISQGGAHEYMVKTKIEPSQTAYYMAKSNTEREAILARLLEKGVTHIGGRPIEDVVVLTIPIDMKGNEFQDIGSVFDTIPLPKIIPKTTAEKAEALGIGESSEAIAAAAL